jgi:hypothetical protein
MLAYNGLLNYSKNNMIYIKKNLSLLLGITLPIVMILLVAASIYLPAMLPAIFKPPQYNFLYSLGSGSAYFVQDGKLQLVSVKAAKNLAKTAAISTAVEKPAQSIKKEKFFIYEVKHNKNTALSFKEAQALHLDTNPQSIDGFSVIKNSGHEFLFWSSGDCCSFYIKNTYLAKRLHIANSPMNYLNDFHFIGWIK